jgi:hypothetical protein
MGPNLRRATSDNGVNGKPVRLSQGYRIVRFRSGNKTGYRNHRRA